MFVLGIDPGLSRCGYGLVGRRGSDLVAEAGGVLTTDAELPLPERLRLLHNTMVEVLAETNPDTVVVERVFCATPVASFFRVRLAPGTMAPLGSLTVPVMPPVSI